MEKTFLRTYLDRKEQNEVKNIYKKYGWTAVSFNFACQSITNRDEFYRNSFKDCCQDPTDENLERFFGSWCVFQASHKKNSFAKRECGRQLIPYLAKVLKQVEQERRKHEMENSLSGLLSGDELEEKWKHKFYVEVRMCNSYSGRGRRYTEMAQQRKATFQPFEINEEGKRQINHYGYAQKLPCSFTIYSNEQGYFDDSVIETKAKETAASQVSYYQSQIAELEQKIKRLDILQQNIERWLA